MANPNWKKGVSGNPGGRPKRDPEVKALAKVHTAEAIEALLTVMRNTDEDSSRVAAAKALLDRGWGTPSQEMRLSIDQLTDEDLRAELERLESNPDPVDSGSEDKAEA